MKRMVQLSLDDFSAIYRKLYGVALVNIDTVFFINLLSEFTEEVAIRDNLRELTRNQLADDDHDIIT